MFSILPVLKVDSHQSTPGLLIYFFEQAECPPKSRLEPAGLILTRNTTTVPPTSVTKSYNRCLCCDDLRLRRRRYIPTRRCLARSRTSSDAFSIVRRPLGSDSSQHLRVPLFGARDDLEDTLKSRTPCCEVLLEGLPLWTLEGTRGGADNSERLGRLGELAGQEACTDHWWAGKI